MGEELTELLGRIDENEFFGVVDEFADPARRWFFSGQGRSGLSARGVAMRVMHIGRECHYIGEVTAPAVRSGDIAVFFSGSGTTPVTVAFMRIAKAEGATVILVTRRADSAGAEIADRVLTIPVVTSEQLGGNLFEHASLMVMDAVVNHVASETLEDPNGTLLDLHTNMQ